MIMNKFEYLEKSRNEIITVDTLDKKNDCFIRYLLSNKGNENIVLDFINGVMIDSNFETFSNVEILNPFNLSKYLDGKESIVDVKCITNNGDTIIIEIQLRGNKSFVNRTLYYWANSYSLLLNKSDNYTKLTPVISISILDYTIFKDIKDFHSCYLLKEIKHNKILTDHCRLHYIELPKFDKNNISKEKLASWLKFFKGENMPNLIKENNIFEEVEKKCKSFIENDLLINAYRKKEWNEYFHNDELVREREEEKKSIAKNMKAKNMDANLISEITGLSIEEVDRL